MNKTRKSLLSLLLAFALLLPMVPARAADNEAANVFLDPDSGVDLYYRESSAKSVTITATADPASYTGTIVWELRGESSDIPLTYDKVLGQALDYSHNRTIKLTATKVTAETSVKLIAMLTGSNGPIEREVEIRVKPDSVEPFKITPDKFELEIGGTRDLGVKAYYVSDATSAPVTYVSDDSTIVSVSKAGVVTAVGTGTTTVTVTSGTRSATAVITVIKPSADLKASTKVGTDLSLLDIYETIMLRFNTAYPSMTPSDITFTDVPTNGCGTLYVGAEEVKSGTYAFTDLRSMIFRPLSAGTYEFGYTANNGARTLSGAVAITVTVPTTDVRIPISSRGDYSFDRASADASGKTGAMLFREATGVKASNRYSLKFGTIESDTVGTLYKSSAATASDRVVNGTLIPTSAIEELYFVPNRSGSFSIGYTIYSSETGTGTVICSGRIVIPVDARTLDVSVNLDSVSAYTFGYQPRSGAETAYAALVRTINDGVGRYSWTGIRFSAPSAASAAVGTLHQSSSYNRAITEDTFVESANISNLYFVPTRSGTYTVGYRVFAASNSTAPLATGTLTINVSNIPSTKADITYITSVNGTVSLLERDFIDFFQAKNGTRYYLSCVVFNDYEGSDSFVYGSERFIPYNSTDLYTSTYNGTLPQYPRYLSRLSFTAPKTAGYTRVKFTCYGGSTASSKTVETSGVLYIYYTSGNVPAVHYDAYSAASTDLREQDFVSVYRTAMNSSVARPVFTIRLLNLPAYGVLYRNYNRSGRTAVSQNNLSTYEFTVNGDSSSMSIGELTYVPNRSTTGTDSFNYIAYASNGDLLFSGSVEFKLGADRSVTVTSDGLGFQAADFYTAGDTDPVIYVTFPTPDSGRMYALSGNRYVPVGTDTKFYVSSSADGMYPISAALYAPRAGSTSSVTLTATAHRRSGATYPYTVVVSVRSKTSSSAFYDVGSVWSWAADSIDFANHLGLVGGTKANPPTFSPAVQMRRCDLVLILYRLAGSPVVSGSMPYTDVTADKYYYSSALWAYQNNITRGVVFGGYYNPESALTRQDFAQILFNYTAAMGISTANSGSLAGYRDAAQVSAETTEGVRWAVANGYITSTSTGTLTIEPQRSATRAEIVTLLHRYLTY